LIDQGGGTIHPLQYFNGIGIQSIVIKGAVIRCNYTHVEFPLKLPFPKLDRPKPRLIAIGTIVKKMLFGK